MRNKKNGECQIFNEKQHFTERTSLIEDVFILHEIFEIENKSYHRLLLEWNHYVAHFGLNPIMHAEKKLLVNRNEMPDTIESDHFIEESSIGVFNSLQESARSMSAIASLIHSEQWQASFWQDQSSYWKQFDEIYSN